MANTWVIDLRHFLTPEGAIAEMPPRARLLAEYFASIVLDATTNFDGPPAVRCRRRPGRRRCQGLVSSYPTGNEHDSIHWHCPICHDNGIITGWHGTLWDGFVEKTAAS